MPLFLNVYFTTFQLSSNIHAFKHGHFKITKSSIDLFYSYNKKSLISPQAAKCAVTDYWSRAVKIFKAARCKQLWVTGKAYCCRQAKVCTCEIQKSFVWKVKTTTCHVLIALHCKVRVELLVEGIIFKL